MKTFLAAAFAAVAAANEPHLVDSTPSNAIAITQTSGMENFVMTQGVADPDPIKLNNREYFNIDGIWNVDGSVIDKVDFQCYILGVKVFDQSFPCASGDANCPTPAGNIGEAWHGSFYFDVPPVGIPGATYDVHVIGQTADETSLFELVSDFKIN